MSEKKYKELAITLLSALETEHQAYMDAVILIQKSGLASTGPDNAAYDKFIETAKEILEI